MPGPFQKFYVAPLLPEASVHVSTSGVFKGLCKDSAIGIGGFGAGSRDANAARERLFVLETR